LKKSVKVWAVMNIRLKVFQIILMLKQIKGMERWIFLTILIICLFLILSKPPSLAQDTLKSLTLLHTNNINGEIDPCPT
jgi:hypothetical protein